MNYKKKISLLSAFVLAWGSGLWAAEQISQATGTADFAQNITVKSFDRYNGTFYVGTGVANLNYSLARAARGATVFEGIAIDPAATNATITSPNIALINNGNAAATHLAFKGDGGTATDLKVMQLNGTTYPVLETPLGGVGTANAICDAAGAAAGGFTYLAGGNNYLFLRVQANATGEVANSGVLAFTVAGATAPTRILDASGNASLLDPIKGTVAGNGEFLRITSASADLAAAPVSDMYWDQQLGTLFVAGNLTARASADFAMAITQVAVNSLGELEIYDTLPNGVNPLSTNTTTIFASTSSGAGAINPRILKIRTMHTSTDRVYLIVNGGIGALAANVGNLFYCLQYDRDTTFVTENNAAKTPLVNDFIRNGGGAGQSLDGGNVGSLVIGAGVAPWPVADPATDMEVIGDTVYVSYATARDGTHQPGVWASRAMFNQDGVIVGWTPWESVFANEGIGTLSDLISFFAVDPMQGVLWKVCNNATGPQVVKRTRWTQTTADEAGTALDERLNYDFGGDAVTAILDLPTGTPGIGNVGGANESNSFALFGGNEQVVFAQTKSANANAVTTDFNVNTAYKLTSLPSGAGYVRALGYSRSPAAADTKNYFFAGVDKGLYVWALTAATAAAQTGYNAVAGLTNLDAVPFATPATFSWQRMAADLIPGAVTAIEANGTSVFVVEQDITSKGKIVDRLHRFTIDSNVSAMVASHVIIAQSGVGGIPANTIFTGFTIVSNTGIRANAFYGVLTTNNGVYISDLTLDAILPVATQPADSWYFFPNDDSDGAYVSLSPVKRVPTALATNTEDGNSLGFTASALADAGNNYWQQGAILNSGINFVGNTDKVFPYVNATSTPAGLNTTYLERLSAFWTDGARRFFTTYDPNLTVGNTFKSMPYNTAEWNMTTGPVAINGFVDDTTTPWSINRVNCMESISGLGVVVAGTSDGVVVLE